MRKAYIFYMSDGDELIVNADNLNNAKKKAENKLGKKLSVGTKYSSEFFMTSLKDVQRFVMKHRTELFNKTMLKLGYDKQFTKDVMNAMKEDAINPKTGKLKVDFQYDYDLYNFKESIPEGWSDFYEKKTGKIIPKRWDSGGSFTNFPFESKRPKILKKK